MTTGGYILGGLAVVFVVIGWPWITRALNVSDPVDDVLGHWESYDSVEYCAELWDDVFPEEWEQEALA